MNEYSIEYDIRPFDGGDKITTGSSFIFHNQYRAMEYAQAFSAACVKGVGLVSEVRVKLNGAQIGKAKQ